MSVSHHVPGRILVMTAPYGDGHTRASEAIVEAFAEVAPDVEVVLIDYFKMFVNDALVAASRQAYLQSIKKLPASYGLFYRSIGALEPDSTIRRTIDRVGRTGLSEFLNDNRFDAVISLYPIPSGALSHLRENGSTDATAVTVITDYTCHPEWIHNGTDLYVVGSDAVAGTMVERGVNAEKIRVLGIPVRAAFRCRRPDRKERARPSILVMAGAYGALSGIRGVIDVLASRSGAIDATFVCGRAQALRRRLVELTSTWERAPRVLGFIDDVAAEMWRSDLVVSKAGGITVSESLALGRPLIIYRTIPGQEARNAEFLEEAGAGLSVRTPAKLRSALDRLLGDARVLEEMSEAARRVGKPGAAPDVVDLVLQTIGRRAIGEDARG